MIETAKLIVNSNIKIDETIRAWKEHNRFPHAILIEGENGIGKNYIAHYIAAATFCESEEKPCGTCAGCVKVDKNIHPDLLYYEGEGRVNSFHVDAVREIKKESYIAPNDSRHKVFILNKAEDMTIAAQNALLKLIEEPPKNVKFILACENKSKMLVTIRSRATTLSAELLSYDTIKQILHNNHPGFTEDDYSNAVGISRGNLGVSEEYLTDETARDRYTTAVAIWQSLKQKNQIEAMAKTIVFERDKQQFAHQLELIRKFAVQELAESTNNRLKGLSPLQLLKIIDTIDEIKTSINFNVNMLIATTIFVDRVSTVIKN